MRHEWIFLLIFTLFALLFLFVPVSCAVRLGLALIVPGKSRTMVVKHPWYHVAWLAVSAMIVLSFSSFSSGQKDNRARIAAAKGDEAEIVNALKAYRVDYGSMPGGDAAEIVKALRGKNPRHTVFMEVPPERISPGSGYLDPWDSAYKIDVSNPDKPRVYSFGKDKQDNGGAEGTDDVVSWR